MDIFKYMYKVSPSQEAKMSKQDKMNLLTDGRGGLFKTPSVGRTPLFSVEGLDSFKFDYDWELKQLDIYIRDVEHEKDANIYNYITSYSIAPENVADGVDYWCKVAVEDMNTEIDSAIEDLYVSEAFNVYGEHIDDDKEIYSYVILIDITELNWDSEDDWNEQVNDLCNYQEQIELFGTPVQVTAIKAEYDIPELHVDAQLPLTKEDLIEIFNDYEDGMRRDFKKAGKDLNIRIEYIEEI